MHSLSFFAPNEKRSLKIAFALLLCVYWNITIATKPTLDIYWTIKIHSQLEWAIYVTNWHVSHLLKYGTIMLNTLQNGKSFYAIRDFFMWESLLCERIALYYSNFFTNASKSSIIQLMDVVIGIRFAWRKVDGGYSLCIRTVSVTKQLFRVRRSHSTLLKASFKWWEYVFVAND